MCVGWILLVSLFRVRSIGDGDCRYNKAVFKGCSFPIVLEGFILVQTIVAYNPENPLQFGQGREPPLKMTINTGTTNVHGVNRATYQNVFAFGFNAVFHYEKLSQRNHGHPS